MRRLPWGVLCPTIAGLFGFSATLHLFYPGFMSWDSTSQFEQAVTGEINNAHPPIMVYLWASTNRVFYGPAGMLAVQSAAYWAGLVLVACYAARRAAWRAVLVLGIGFFPPLFGILPTLWKDSGSLAALLLASGLILHAHRRRAATPAWLALPFVFYAFAVRFNNALTILPLLWPLSEALVLSRKTIWRGRRHALVCSGVFLGLLSAMLALTLAVNTVGVRRYAYFVAVPLWDLAQISLDTNQLLVPAVAITRPGLDLRRLRWISRPYRCDYRRISRDGRMAQDIEWTHLSQREAREIVGHWLGAIVDHPRAYLGHRWRVAEAALFDPTFGTPRRTAAALVFGEQRLESIRTFALPFEFHARPGHASVKRVLAFCAGTILCRPWLYLLIATAWCILGWRARSEEVRLAGSLASSGLLSVIPLAVIAPSTDFRYFVWLVAAAVIASVIAIARRARAEYVGRPGLEPGTNGLKARCSTS